jgi:hypothetical protein
MHGDMNVKRHHVALYVLGLVNILPYIACVDGVIVVFTNYPLFLGLLPSWRAGIAQSL